MTKSPLPTNSRSQYPFLHTLSQIQLWILEMH
ncbi:unnamed protein product, partial [Vitis vinifera]|uniref:Uncharacterized protein n=1 Tax=Vitis vinifera TaxID=29760 RepID=D7TET0_VITVI